MTDAIVTAGYHITHPHDPYEGVVAFEINQFSTGDKRWQAQIYSNGSLIDADYFATEVDALRWAAREITLIACVSGTEAAQTWPLGTSLTAPFHPA